MLAAWYWIISTLVGLFPAANPTEAPSIEWRAPYAECPDARDLIHDVSALVGRVPSSSEVSAVGLVDRAQGGWRLELRVSIGGRIVEKTISASSCGQLAHAAALVVAVAMDFSAGDPSREPEAEPAPDPKPLQTVPEPDQPDALPTVERSRLAPVSTENRRVAPWVPMIAVGANVTYGRVPGMSGGPTVLLGVQRKRFAGELQARYELPRRSRPRLGGAATVQLVTAGAQGCFVANADTIDVPLCLGVEAGALIARGAGLSRPRVRRLPWLAAVASVAVRWWIRPRWALSLGVDATGAAIRPQVVADAGPTHGAVVLHDPGWAGARGRLAVVWKFAGTRGGGP